MTRQGTLKPRKTNYKWRKTTNPSEVQEDPRDMDMQRTHTRERQTKDSKSLPPAPKQERTGTP